MKARRLTATRLAQGTLALSLLVAGGASGALGDGLPGLPSPPNPNDFIGGLIPGDINWDGDGGGEGPQEPDLPELPMDVTGDSDGSTLPPGSLGGDGGKSPSTPQAPAPQPQPVSPPPAPGVNPPGVDTPQAPRPSFPTPGPAPRPALPQPNGPDARAPDCPGATPSAAGGTWNRFFHARADDGGASSCAGAPSGARPSPVLARDRPQVDVRYDPAWMPDGAGRAPGARLLDPDGVPGKGPGDGTGGPVGARSPHAVSVESSERPPTSVGVANLPQLAGATALLAVGAAGLAALPPLWRLYRRLSRPDVLSNGTRKRIHEIVISSPGTTAGAIARDLGVDRRTVIHHLRILREFHLVEARIVGARSRYYQNGGTYTPHEKAALVALGSDKARTILKAILRSPGSSLAQVAETTGVPKSTVKFHVDRFKRMGVVEPESGRVRSEAVDLLVRGA